MQTAETKAETVLVVDDDVRVVELLQITLGGRGYHVLSAYDGEGALKAVKGGRPDLLVLDVRLPGKSGFEVLDTVRRDSVLRHLPVILISADAATESRLQGLKLGADDYLAKPFSPRELIIKIRRILDRAQDRNLLLIKTEVLEEEIRRNRDTLIQMRQELGQNLNRMGTMLSSVVELNRFHSMHEILDRFVVTTVGNLDFDRIALLIPGEGGRLRPRVSQRIEESALRGLWLAESGPVARLCVSMRRPVRVDEFESFPEAREEVLRLSAAGLALVTPAMAQERLRGLLLLGERSSDQPLGRFEYKLLEILGASIVAALRNAEAFNDTQRSFLETAAQLITNIEGRYPYISGHSERVARTALAIGEALHLDHEDMENLRYGALLHDLGQVDRYGELLERSVLLTPSDRDRHRRLVAENVTHLLGPGGQGAAGDIVRHHQEYWDGSGLPDGWRESEIPLGARIVALANAWDALVHDRPHRKAYSRDEARRILSERAGKQFDPNLVPLLVQVVESPLTGALTT